MAQVPVSSYPSYYPGQQNIQSMHPGLSQGSIQKDAETLKRILNQADMLAPQSGFNQDKRYKALDTVVLLHDAEIEMPLEWHKSQYPIQESMQGSLVSRQDKEYTIGKDFYADPLYQSVARSIPSLEFYEQMQQQAGMAQQMQSQSKSMQASRQNLNRSQFTGPQGQPMAPMGYSEVAHICETKQTEFLDTQFPPNQTSIGSLFPAYNWARSRRIYNDKQVVFGPNIQPIDVVPGALNDLYFLSALGALAAKPPRITQLLVSKEKNSKGCYAAKLVWKGVWQEVILDDYFPICRGQPVFSRGRNQELWPLILEKAWAKLHGSYSQIEQGVAREALHDLSGAPTKALFTGVADDQLWKVLTFGVDKTFLQIATPNDLPTSSTQLDTSTSYVITNACEIIDKNGNTHRVIRLKNHWNVGDWNGPFNDADQIWKQFSAQQQKLAGYPKKKEPWNICMSYQDFLTHFNDIAVSCYVDGWIYHGIASQSLAKEPKYYTFHVAMEGLYAFQVSQRTIRTLSPKRQDEINQADFYSRVILIIMKYGSSTPIVAVHGAQRDLTSWKAILNRTTVTTGDYYACVIIDWKSNDTIFGVGAYGPRKVEIAETPGNTIGQFPAYCQALLSDPSKLEQV